MNIIKLDYISVDTCYKSKILGLVNEKNLILVNIRELDRELCTGLSILYTNT